MYETMHLDLAKQRHQDLIAEAQRVNVPAHLKSDVDSERMVAVKSVFAGIAATLSSLMKPKAATQTAPSTGC
jgi:hypothetical protein